MFVMSIFFTGALVFQSIKIYLKLLDSNTDDIKGLSELSFFAVGSAYSVSIFRMVYGFDYGVWAYNSYMTTIIYSQLMTFVFSIYITASLTYLSKRLSQS